MPTKDLTQPVYRKFETFIICPSTTNSRSDVDLITIIKDAVEYTDPTDRELMAVSSWFSKLYGDKDQIDS